MSNSSNLNILNQFNESSVLIDVVAKDNIELLKILCEFASKHGRIKDTFYEALIQREEKYPTGLNIDGFGFAIPHTDAEHVNEPGVIVAKLNQSIEFREMGSEDGCVKVEYVFLLLLNNDGSQVKLLQGLMALCSDLKTIDKLRTAVSPKNIIDAITDFFSSQI